MTDYPNEESFQQRVFKIIKEKTGVCNVVVTPEIFIHLCGDTATALMLSHLCYWTDRGVREDGFLWKSAREWMQEVGLTRRQLNWATARLEEMKLLKVEKKLAQGHPTLHYWLNQVNLLKAICTFKPNHMYKRTNATCTDGQMLQRLYPENSSETLKNEKGSPRKRDERALSLKAFLKDAKVNGWQVEEEALEVVRYFLQEYKRHRREDHPNLKLSQWQQIFSTILSCDDTSDLTVAHHKLMIDRYFNTFFENCDYRIMHYNTDGIKRNRLYEAYK